MPSISRLAALLLVPALLVTAGCGGGGGGGGGRVVVRVPNPGTALIGIWTGTFSDQYGHYTVSLEIDAVETIASGDLGWAATVWGAESGGLEVGNGEFLEDGPDRYTFAYDTFDPETGEQVDTVSGTLFLLEGGAAEGSFSTTSGTFGEFSLALTDGFTLDMMTGAFAMEFSDAGSRELLYLGEVVFDAFGNVVPGSGSYLTDDLEGDIDPDANVWPLIGGSLTLLDADVGYYEGVLEFEDPDDRIYLGGYLGLDFFVYGGIFEDILGTGLFTFVPLD